MIWPRGRLAHWEASRLKLVTLALVTLPFLLPTATATSSCSAWSATATVGDTYVFENFGSPSYVEVWTESNGVGGLQREPCRDGNGVLRPSDTLEAATPYVYAPCVNLLGFRLCVF